MQKLGWQIASCKHLFAGQDFTELVEKPMQNKIAKLNIKLVHFLKGGKTIPPWG